MCRPVFLLTIFFCSGCSIVNAAQRYSIKDITPTGYSAATAYDINSAGDAAGIASRFMDGSLEEAFFFYDHSAGTSLVFGVGTVRTGGAIAMGSSFREAAINDSGQIAGTARFVGGSPQSRGFIYSGGASGSFTNLGTFTPISGIRPASDALDINSGGLATGTASTGVDTVGSTPRDYVDVYTGSGFPITDIDTELTPLSGGDFGRAINDAGVVAGSTGSSEGPKAALFSGATETVFLSATTLASVTSFATDLNEVGQVTGNTGTNASFIYNTTSSALRILPNLDPAAGRVFAKGINESGDVVGWGDRGDGLSDQGRGFVHDFSANKSYILEDQVILTGSTVTGLSDWGDLRTAWGINDSGWIVGVGDRRFGSNSFPTSRAYLLIPTAVPEPGSMLALGGTAMLLAMRRRRPH